MCFCQSPKEEFDYPLNIYPILYYIGLYTDLPPSFPCHSSVLVANFMVKTDKIANVYLPREAAWLVLTLT